MWLSTILVLRGSTHSDEDSFKTNIDIFIRTAWFTHSNLLNPICDPKSSSATQDFTIPPCHCTHSKPKLASRLQTRPTGCESKRLFLLLKSAEPILACTDHQICSASQDLPSEVKVRWQDCVMGKMGLSCKLLHWLMFRYDIFVIAIALLKWGFKYFHLKCQQSENVDDRWRYRRYTSNPM